MAQKKIKVDKNGSVKTLPTVWNRAITAQSEWPDKDEFLDVVYWARQILGIILGIVWGVLHVKGFVGILLFCIANAAVIYLYSSYQKIDDEEFGGTWEIVKEGFMTSFAGFMVTWIIIYSGLHFS